MAVGASVLKLFQMTLRSVRAALKERPHWNGRRRLASSLWKLIRLSGGWIRCISKLSSGKRRMLSPLSQAIKNQYFQEGDHKHTCFAS